MTRRHGTAVGKQNAQHDQGCKFTDDLSVKQKYDHAQNGKEDVFSLPEKAIELYEKCGSDMKELVWFEKGDHSQLRISNEESYDKEIREFLRRVHINNEETKKEELLSV